jgi:hypothetical protein
LGRRVFAGERGGKAVAETDRRRAVDPERAAEIEIALGADRTATQLGFAELASARLAASEARLAREQAVTAATISRNGSAGVRHQLRSRRVFQTRQLVDSTFQRLPRWIHGRGHSDHGRGQPLSGSSNGRLSSFDESGVTFHYKDYRHNGQAHIAHAGGTRRVH